ncbi:transcription factor IBH1-like [Panicum miliaceum]|uniref:Transcription factor IBH1-like n=1 Tax=Panicum miliaceum TaxID=4540 RepID=A0A3L6SK74_PANMI|nr:transcription factor IBH1-like [Panicum miliaceum]
MDHYAAILEADGQEGVERLKLVRERGRRIKAAAELGLARSSRGSQWGRALGRRSALAVAPEDDAFPFEVTSSSMTGNHLQVRKKAASPEEDDDDDEEVAVEEKVALLRRLVPGGEGMAVEVLLQETADYIAALKAQVGVMRALACLLSGSGLDALPEKGDGLLTPEKPQ